MSSDRTVLEHLLDGRDALVLEVKRLSTAIEELDSVIARIGGVATATIGDPSALADLNIGEPVNSTVEMEPTASTASKRTAKAPAKRTAKKSTSGPRKSTPAKQTGRRSTPADSSGQKSIRVHVLDMLGAENRDFGLAEIIDRIHAEGIQAHDDAVRSITIKLMKDGRVERVGRGLYRLKRRGSADPAGPGSAQQATSQPASDAQSTAADAASAGAQPAAQNYVPPLNLGQSWGGN